MKQGLCSVKVEISRSLKTNVCTLEFTDINGRILFKSANIQLPGDLCEQEIVYCRIKSILAEAGILHNGNAILIFDDERGCNKPRTLTARGTEKWVLLNWERDEKFTDWTKAPERTITGKELRLDFSQIKVF